MVWVWKCNIGVLNSTWSSTSTLNDITFLDVDRPFSVFLGDYSTEIMTASYFNQDEATFKNSMYNNFESVFGYVANVIYGFPPQNSTSTAKSMSNEYLIQFPSLRAGYPNAWSSYFNEDVVNFVVYFPSQGILIYFPTSTNGTAYKVNNGSINKSSLVAGLFRDMFSLHYSSTNQYKAVSITIPTANVDSTSTSVTKDQCIGLAVRWSTLSKNSYFYGDASYTNYSTQCANFINLLLSNGGRPEIYDPSEPDDPYEPGGESGEGNLPPGTFDDSSDIIEDSSLPSISAADTGFTRIYNPTLSQVQALARYLWTDETVLDTIWNHIKQFFEDPMQAIIGFNLVPCAVPDGGTRSFALMYIDTGVQMTAAASQFVDVDCGTVQLDRYYGAALDQNPYTKVSCFLPYIGMVHLNTDEVMGTTLHVKYRIDIVSGSCVAKIFVDGSLLYQYSGHCAINIPFSSADFSNYVTAAISVGAAVAGLAVGAAAGVGAVAESEALVVSEGAGPLTSAETMALVGGQGGEQTSGSTQAMFNGLSAKNITNTVGQVMGSKMQVEHAGSFSGNSGYLGVRRPFLLIERPNQCLPSSYGHLNGYPSMITLNLGECSGFTKVQQVQLTGVTATNPEQDEILQFLKSGVYL